MIVRRAKILTSATMSQSISYNINIHQVNVGNTQKEAPAKNMKFEQMFYLQRAATIAFRSNLKSHRHGCVIVSQSGQIIAEGYNHVSNGINAHSIHAEVHALTKYRPLRKQYPNCTMYVVRIGTERMGNPLKYSRPCAKCSEHIEDSDIRRVYYSTSDEFNSIFMQEFLQKEFPPE